MRGRPQQSWSSLTLVIVLLLTTLQVLNVQLKQIVLKGTQTMKSLKINQQIKIHLLFFFIKVPYTHFS